MNDHPYDRGGRPKVSFPFPRRKPQPAPVTQQLRTLALADELDSAALDAIVPVVPERRDDRDRTFEELRGALLLASGPVSPGDDATVLAHKRFAVLAEDAIDELLGSTWTAVA